MTFPISSIIIKLKIDFFDLCSCISIIAFNLFLCKFKIELQFLGDVYIIEVTPVNRLHFYVEFAFAFFYSC